MKTLLLSTALLLSLGAQAMAAGSHGGGHDDEMAIGRPGDAAHVDRTIEIKMIETEDGEMLFEPASLDVKKGETVKFVISNTGEQEHELVLDTSEKVIEHKALMEKFPEMEHDDPNAVRLEPGATGEILWTFTNAGTFEAACLIPGHYEAGMHAALSVN